MQSEEVATLEGNGKGAGSSETIVAFWSDADPTMLRGQMIVEGLPAGVHGVNYTNALPSSLPPSGMIASISMAPGSLALHRYHFNGVQHPLLMMPPIQVIGAHLYGSYSMNMKAAAAIGKSTTVRTAAQADAQKSANGSGWGATRKAAATVDDPNKSPEDPGRKPEDSWSCDRSALIWVLNRVAYDEALLASLIRFDCDAMSEDFPLSAACKQIEAIISPRLIWGQKLVPVWCLRQLVGCVKHALDMQASNSKTSAIKWLNDQVQDRELVATFKNRAFPLDSDDDEFEHAMEGFDFSKSAGDDALNKFVDTAPLEDVLVNLEVFYGGWMQRREKISTKALPGRAELASCCSTPGLPSYCCSATRLRK